jgi:RNA polymerase sigma-70 factor, ECF subfamily
MATGKDEGEAPGYKLTEKDLADHAATIRRYLSGILRPNELEDATQSVLQRALENLPKFRGDASPRVWLLGIARNVGFEVARARQRDIARAWQQSVETGESSLNVMAADLFADGNPSVEDQLGRKEQQALALVALDGLSLDDRLALLVTYVDGLPGPEAAELLGVSFAAFRQRLSRARQSLQARLEVLLERGEPGDAAVLHQWQVLLNPEGKPQTGDLPPRDET